MPARVGNETRLLEHVRGSRNSGTLYAQHCGHEILPHLELVSPHPVMNQLEPAAHSLIERVQAITSRGDRSHNQECVRIASDHVIQRSLALPDLTNEVSCFHTVSIAFYLYEGEGWRRGHLQPELDTDQAFNTHQTSLDAAAILHFLDRGSDRVVGEEHLRDWLVGLD